MFKKYIERVKDAGVVGAGGAGFPTHIKLNIEAEVVIVNGAECEPLLRVDQQLMEVYPDKIVKGLHVAMKITGAKRGVICLKEKYTKAIESLKPEIIDRDDMSLHIIGNYYPAGDEQQLVYEVMGKVIPIGGLPIDVGAVVNNVATMFNIANAANNIPVTNRFVTIIGEVNNPMTVNAPIGTPISDLIRIADGPSSKEGYTLILGGPAMGKVEENWDTPVTKTLGGVIILPTDHSLIKKKTLSNDKELKLSKSVCCQCNNCTQMCPRNLLGLGTAPHKVMRGLAYGNSEALGEVNSIFSCCDCGICTYYACDMGLSPSKMVTLVKGSLMKKGIKANKMESYEVSKLREYKKVPTKRFIQRLDLKKYDMRVPFITEEVEIQFVNIPLKQHIGTGAKPVVKEGDYVGKCDLIGIVDEGKFGAHIHASISGHITFINDQYIEIKALEGGK